MKRLIRRIKCHFGFHEFWNVYFQHRGDPDKHLFVNCRWCQTMFTSGIFVNGPAEKCK